MMEFEQLTIGSFSDRKPEKHVLEVENAEFYNRLEETRARGQPSDRRLTQAIAQQDVELTPVLRRSYSSLPNNCKEPVQSPEIGFKV
jgi:hypothetical protein